MKRAMIDSNGILLAHGFSDFKAGVGQTVLDVDDSFNLMPGTVEWNGGKWIPYIAPSLPRTLSDGELGEVLVKKGLLAPSEIISSG